VLELSPGDGDHIVLRAHLPHWDGLIHLVDRARRIANLDADPDEPSRHLAGDQAIGPLVVARPGLRVPGTWDPYETGVRAIIGQQVTIAGANTITARVVGRFGTPVAGLAPLGLTHTFPTPDTLAGADLTGLGLTRWRAEAIRSFSRAVADDTVRLDRSVGLDQLVASITALPGLGPWTAHYIALRLGEPNAFPAADLGILRALAQRVPQSVSAVSELADRWQPWRALAAAHLWMAA
jgi:AraC family transcriptional regulator, regulatory protein of adaptative response / DNA-3-methyladenine glycosylase II